MTGFYGTAERTRKTRTTTPPTRAYVTRSHRI